MAGITLDRSRAVEDQPAPGSADKIRSGNNVLIFVVLGEAAGIFQNMNKYNDLHLLYVAIAVIVLVMFGCAAREPSSTDHHQVPRVICQPVKAGGSIRVMCCENERCVFKP